jgi:hypothetical protein
MRFSMLLKTFGLLAISLVSINAADITVTDSMVHLRQNGPREWSTFKKTPDASSLKLEFEVKDTKGDFTLRLRQRDLKQIWRITINGKKIGDLHRDENDMIVYFAVPQGVLKSGTNVLEVKPSSTRTPDDIEVGEVSLLNEKMKSHLAGCRLNVKVVDAESKQPIPCRITVIRPNGALQQTGAKSNDHLAVRPGTVYSANGQATIPLPPGPYQIFAGRGFEYSLASAKVTLDAGSEQSITLTIRREVNTKGYVACDTHVHTRTHSGHGDSTVQERMITLAAEGIELPIATDHNVHIDHNPFAKQMKVRQYFTPVIGNEVTTKPGHFNVFPIDSKATPPDHKSDDWAVTFRNIKQTAGVRVIILNHARDVHSGVTPFGPKLFNDAVGVNVKGWELKANAMEILNSSATQTDIMELSRDWMTLLNRDLQITPVGCSDSHDVARHFVGQGRTYIRCDDRDPGNIDVEKAVDSFLAGRVNVSYGLMTKLTVDEKYESGELAKLVNDKVRLRVEVHAPHWIAMSKVMLFANGVLVMEEEPPPLVDGTLPLGVKFVKEWTIPKPKHDVHLVAIAIGPGIDGSYWRTAKAYQPTSDVWIPHVFGCSGAIWLDADADGRPTSAFEYAKRVFTASKGNFDVGLKLLQEYDAAVAAQAAHLYQSSGTSLANQANQKKVNASSAAVKTGFRRYLEAWRRTLE